MNSHPNITPASPCHTSPLFDASFDSIESLTTTFASPVVPTSETTTVTEVALGNHRNGQYSITAMTTSSGAVAERYAYTVYGQPTILNASGTVLTSSSVGNRYTYTGREWDETLGLHHFRARWMSPLAGRFLGRDPIGYAARSWNIYEFVRSRAVGKQDPFGLYQVPDDEDDRPTYPTFDPDWIGSSGCFEYCMAAGHSSKRCNDYCRGTLPPDYPPLPHPDWPIAWGEEVAFVDFPLPSWGNSDDGNGNCKCTFDRNSSTSPGYHIERPRCADGTRVRPGLSPTNCCTPGSEAAMRYLGTCEKNKTNCDCSESTCFAYIKFLCNDRGMWTWGSRIVEIFYTPCSK